MGDNQPPGGSYNYNPPSNDTLAKFSQNVINQTTEFDDSDPQYMAIQSGLMRCLSILGDIIAQDLNDKSKSKNGDRHG